ncbi:MAG: acetolactate synthase small subunit, partial [Bauldia sp.]|uniref:acetolactate synthase small subunit n=1 Tax=Bauldia sp. TaxID=2575872 RepID=UPI001D7BCF7A
MATTRTRKPAARKAAAGTRKAAAAKKAPARKAPAKRKLRHEAELPSPAPASAYFIEERHERYERHTLSVTVDNEPGVLARVVGLFSGRGYNIDSLTVSETEHAKHQSRITIV